MPPDIASSPAPPFNLSLPSPPFRVSLPALPKSWSSPSPPSKLFSPLFPLITLAALFPVALILEEPFKYKFSTLLEAVKPTDDRIKSVPVPSPEVSVIVSLLLSTI